MPPIFYNGQFTAKLLLPESGHFILAGVAVCLLGIAVAGLAGMSKEREMSDEQKKSLIKEFNFKKGILVATFSGVMSARFSYGLYAGRPIKQITTQLHGTPELWQGLPVLVVILLGGFTVNVVWCLLLNHKNRTGFHYFSGTVRDGGPGRDGQSIGHRCPSDLEIFRGPSRTCRVPCWFYSPSRRGTCNSSDHGRDQMEKNTSFPVGLCTWPALLSSARCGDRPREWKGSSRRTIGLVTLGLAMLVGSTLLVGYGNYLATSPGPAASQTGRVGRRVGRACESHHGRTVIFGGTRKLGPTLQEYFNPFLPGTHHDRISRNPEDPLRRPAIEESPLFPPLQRRRKSWPARP